MPDYCLCITFHYILLPPSHAAPHLYTLYSCYHSLVCYLLLLPLSLKCPTLLLPSFHATPDSCCPKHVCGLSLILSLTYCTLTGAVLDSYTDITAHNHVLPYTPTAACSLCVADRRGLAHGPPAEVPQGVHAVSPEVRLLTGQDPTALSQTVSRPKYRRLAPKQEIDLSTVDCLSKSK